MIFQTNKRTNQNQDFNQTLKDFSNTILNNLLTASITQIKNGIKTLIISNMNNRL